MSLARHLLHEFRPLFRLLEEPISRSPAYFGGASSRSLFDDPFFQIGASRPSLDLSEEGSNYVVEAELPGVNKEDINVSLDEGSQNLTIEGTIAPRRSATQATATPTEPSAPSEQATSPSPDTSTEVTASGSNLPVERAATNNVARFLRTVRLPRPVDGTNVSAKLENGILTITLPKVEDKASIRVPVL